MQISHESPIVLLNESRSYNDYDYALVHLFDEYPQYYKFFRNSIKNNRRVILDNSIYQLGKSFDQDKYSMWINKLKPTDYIIPDCFNDKNKTLNMFHNWINKYNDLPGDKIAVIHGKTYSQIQQCYMQYDKYDVKIAFNFADSIYLNLGEGINNDVKIMNGRIKVINELINNNIINTNKKHHILGCTLPQEIKQYTKYNWIQSCDTSNPIVHAIKGIRYKDYGLDQKVNIKLANLIDISIYEIDYELLMYNINMFKKIVKGES